MYTKISRSYDTEAYIANALNSSTTFYKRLYGTNGLPISNFLTSAYSVSGLQHASMVSHYFDVSKNDPRNPLVETTVFEGQKPSVPVVYFRGKEGGKSANFKKECSTGRIVSHPYLVYTGVVRSGEQWTQISSATIRHQPFKQTTWRNYWAELGLFANYRHNGNNRDGLAIPGSKDIWYVGLENGYLNEIKRTEVLTVPPLNGTLQASFQGFAISSLEAIDDVIITETLSKANDKEIDLLTTLAEMPKTVKSVLDGFKLLAKMTKAAKAKEFELTESYTKLMKRNSQLAESKFKEAKRNQRRKKKLDKTDYFKRRSNRIEQQFGSEQASELLDAITGVWMNYRYNIRPIVYTIQDSVSVVEKWRNQYLTVRTVKTLDLSPVSIPGYTFEGTSKITHRCWIKRRYDTSDDWNNFTKLVMGDIFVTAYELIPIWSIVADWFFNVGPVLRAASYNPVHTQQAATYSTKVEIKGKYFLNSDPKVFYSVEFSGYKRKSITPSQHITLTYVNEFDDLKGYDSLSFLWGSLRKPVKNIPNPYRRG